MNLEDVWLVRRSNRDRQGENELSSSSRSRGKPRQCFNPLDPKNEHYTPIITSPARILMAINQHHALQWPKSSEKDPQLLIIFVGMTESMCITPIDAAN
ncbi:UNVERIFIED_CONTAM: hypothetical protein Sradi_5526400 [Sesamum radiatum]|uniref:Uncharacterized protein n=1 Tax=Sesamum radiatum TaxID=300843 RepID=A0AAW2LD27_SESRA